MGLLMSRSLGEARMGSTYSICWPASLVTALPARMAPAAKGEGEKNVADAAATPIRQLCTTPS